MNRIAKTCLTALICICNVASTYAESDEELYMLASVPSEEAVKLVRVDISPSGTSFTNIVTLDDETLPQSGSLTSFVHHENTFYFIASAGNETELYSFDEQTGDATLIDTLDVLGYRLAKNPVDDTVWITIDNSGYPTSIAEIDLSTGDVDLDTEITLDSPRFFSDAFFDGFGTLYGSEYSANTSWTQWWFAVDKETSELTPSCSGGSFQPCWNKNIWLVVANPDTNQIIGTSENALLAAEFHSATMGITTLSSGLEPPYQPIGFTYAPNVQDDPLPPMRPELVMVGMCELG